MKKSFLISFLISSILFTGIFIGIDRTILANKVENIMEDDLELGDLEKEVDKSEYDNELVVLLLGIDGTDLEQEKGLRTDTMVLGRMNFDTGDISLLSIPRDTRVLINGKKDKINHAHSFGGPYLSVKTVEDFLDIDIDYYVKIDFNGLIEIVDAIGGVKLDVPQRMKYSDPTAKPPLNIDLEPGVQLLDGKKSHDFLRYRRYREGDIGRVKAQQYFMKELAKQTMKPSNIFKIDKLIKTYYDYVDTDMPLGTMIKYGLLAGKLDIDNMRTEMVPGEAHYIGELSYWIYDIEETYKLVADMFANHRRTASYDY